MQNSSNNCNELQSVAEKLAIDIISDIEDGFNVTIEDCRSHLMDIVYEYDSWSELEIHESDGDDKLMKAVNKANYGHYDQEDLVKPCLDWIGIVVDDPESIFVK